MTSLNKDQVNILITTIVIIAITYFNNGVKYYAQLQYVFSCGCHSDLKHCYQVCLLDVYALAMYSSIFERLKYLIGLFYHSEY